MSTPGLDLPGWLEWLQQLHPNEIELGLERTAAVAARMGLDQPGVPVFTVAGTNGKGSVCALLAAFLQAAGKRVGLYTSPHFHRFNERVRVGPAEVSDRELCVALASVEAARGETPLTFFEFTTLAALAHFRSAEVEVLVLEVGLGGRLDAVNVIDPDVAVVTSVGLDHAEWLGADLDAIAREKTGIARAGRPLVCGMQDPPEGVRTEALERGARLLCPGTDFTRVHAPGDDRWDWQGQGEARTGLPLPALAGGYQLDNVATALAALAAADALPDEDCLAKGLRAAVVRGRFECHEVRGVEVILDVAHNPAAAAVLADALGARPIAGSTRAVIGMYRDKDVAGVVAALVQQIDAWYPAELAGPRGLAGDELMARLRAAGITPVGATADPLAAFERAQRAAAPGDRIVVLGSFATVAQVSTLSL